MKVTEATELHPKPNSRAEDYEILADVYLSLWKLLTRHAGRLGHLEQMGTTDSELKSHIQRIVRQAKQQLSGRPSEITAIETAYDRTNEFMAMLSNGQSHADAMGSSERRKLNNLIATLKRRGLRYEDAADDALEEVTVFSDTAAR